MYWRMASNHVDSHVQLVVITDCSLQQQLSVVCDVTSVKTAQSRCSNLKCLNELSEHLRLIVKFVTHVSDK